MFTLGVWRSCVAAVNVFFRDIGNVARHVLRLWFYLSPGALLVGQLDAARAETCPLDRPAAAFNPWTILFEAYRAVIYHGHPPDWGALLGACSASLVFLAVAIIVQAPRANVREGPVMVEPDELLSPATRAVPTRRRSQSTSTTWASGTACA